MKITKHVNKGYKRGMTLLEIVIVVAIIAVILGAGIGFFGGALGGAQDKAAQAKINGVTALLESYRITAGNYPSQSQGLQALIQKPTSAPAPRNWRQKMKQMPLDPWNNELVYKYPGSKDPSIYEIISKGEDQTLGTEDDISSQDNF